MLKTQLVPIFLLYCCLTLGCPLWAHVGLVGHAPITNGSFSCPWISSPIKFWDALDRALQKRGEQLVRGHLLTPYDIKLFAEKRVDIVFFNDINHWNRQKNALNIASQLPGKKILICWEPRTVIPAQYTKKCRQEFDAIFTWNPQEVDNKKIFQIHYPVLVPMKRAYKPFSQRRLLTQISANKHSPDAQELYSLRKSCIHYFDTHPEKDFSFYGRRWNPEEHTTYGGEVQNKIETLEQFRFALCFENAHCFPGYITEKIFDCFAAGCVPIYYGAPDIDSYIPRNCYIPWKNFSSIQDLYTHLENISEEQYQKYIDNIRTFLTSKKATIFSNTGVINKILRAIDKIRADSTPHKKRKKRTF